MPEDEINVSFVGGNVIVKDIIMDYIHHPTEPDFEKLSLWRFVEMMECIPIRRDAESDSLENQRADLTQSASKPPGRQRTQCGCFAHTHPKREAYLLRF